ncbi:hypothetical protein [Jidongwangia harbinensis]|uniref:hypothetical protein n=1 Tax=Jidongwangia harbinensis TaxID=2878561 RepID=UPI001CD98E22|nr:hypothetical protein [Jidongwangia harbinensis]MCA2212360.1 hypothetical protein [Jidongwangia harbinensis]
MLTEVGSAIEFGLVYFGRRCCSTPACPRRPAGTALSGNLLGILVGRLLGSLADRYGLAAAFTLEPVLIGICLLMLWGGLRARNHATVYTGGERPDGRVTGR